MLSQLQRVEEIAGADVDALPVDVVVRWPSDDPGGVPRLRQTIRELVG